MYDIEGLQRGDDQAWARVQDRYLRRVFFYVRRHVNDYQLAEDLTQDTFVGAIKGIQRYDPGYNFEQYLFGIARNKVIDHFRKVGRPELTPSGTPKDGDERLDRMAVEPASTPTASRLVIDKENAERRKGVLVQILRQLVERYWEKGEVHKLKTIELVFRRNETYTDIVRKVGLRDERVVAGIKFQAIRELQKMAKKCDPHRTLFSALWGRR